MEIIAKKVITLYTVEISLQEYWEALTLAVEIVNKDLTKWWAYELKDNKSFVSFAKKFSDGAEVTLDVAKDMYENYLCNDVAHLVVRYIARVRGYDMQHYGIYDKRTKVIRCTFQGDGAHI